MEFVLLLAKIVAIADEIRKNMHAKGEEAVRQFEEAVARNKVSFDDMVVDLGGTKPPAPTPVAPANELYDRWIEDPGDEKLSLGDHVYGRPADALVYVSKGGPIRIGFIGAPKPENLRRVV